MGSEVSLATPLYWLPGSTLEESAYSRNQDVFDLRNHNHLCVLSKQLLIEVVELHCHGLS